MGPGNKLAYLLQHLSSVIDGRSEQVLHSQLGIGLSQFKILMILEWNPRVSQRSIADSLGQTEASISRQIKVLAAKDLVISKRDPTNRRKYVIAPTPRGMQVTESGNNLLRRALDSELSTMGGERLQQIVVDLQDLHAVVCRAGTTGACDHPLGL